MNADNIFVFENNYQKLKKIIISSIKKEKYNKALSALYVLAFLCYEWNQNYKDLFLEECINDIEDKILCKRDSLDTLDNSTVVYYDGIGQDTRGLTMIYLKALTSIFKRVVYVTNEKFAIKQDVISREMKDTGFLRENLSDTKSYSEQVIQLYGIMEKYKPCCAFQYTMPNDVVGASVFTNLGKHSSITRFQINLTDHAFWMGLNTFDYLIEFRDYGAVISRDHRGVDEKKIIKLPYYPIVNEEKFKGFSFDTDNKQIIFSGGNLYKTIDKELTYYNIIRSVLDNRENVLFYYTGSGDSSHLEELKESFPGRVFYESERTDLIDVMRNSTIYLNTYPMVGGLMMQYAAIAGKIPITLRHNNDADGILINQKEIGIEYDNSRDLVNDVLSLLDDSEYLEARQKKLLKCVPSKKDFENALKAIVESSSSPYKIDYYSVDTHEFIKDYINRFNIDNISIKIARKQNKELFFYYPTAFIKRLVNEGKKRLICK